MENLPYNAFFMKDPNIVINIMDTYGGLTVMKDKKVSNRIFNMANDDQVASFKYTKQFDNKFELSHIVDDHNNLRQKSYHQRKLG